MGYGIGLSYLVIHHCDQISGKKQLKKRIVLVHSLKAQPRMMGGGIPCSRNIQLESPLTFGGIEREREKWGLSDGFLIFDTFI